MVVVQREQNNHERADVRNQHGKRFQKQVLEQNPDIQKDWDDIYGDRMVKIVFIGQGISKEEISKELDEI